MLVLGALPVADLVPENTAEDIKAVVLIAQQMIESACKTTLAAAAQLGKIEEHDLHPINLLLPLVVHSLALCGDTQASVNQQRVAWHIARRSASLSAKFLSNGLGLEGGLPLPKDGDPTLVRELQAARREVAEVKKEAEVAVAFQKTLVDRLTSELEQASGAALSTSAAKGGTGGKTTTMPSSEKKSSKSKGEAPAKKGGGAKKKAITERRVEFSSA